MGTRHDVAQVLETVTKIGTLSCRGFEAERHLLGTGNPAGSGLLDTAIQIFSHRLQTDLLALTNMAARMENQIGDV
jgi:hypothetical protein